MVSSRSRIDNLTKPELETDQRPEQAARVGTPFELILDGRSGWTTLEQPSRAQARWRQHIEHQMPQGAPKPARHRHPKRALPAADGGARKAVFDRSAQERLGGPHVDEQLRRQTCREFNQLVIE